jgi:hypothetical protein
MRRTVLALSVLIIGSSAVAAEGLFRLRGWPQFLLSIAIRARCLANLLAPPMA